LDTVPLKMTQVAPDNGSDWDKGSDCHRPVVLEWAAAHGRDLPWRHTRDPWAVLVSEVMAQQTQVARVIPKWLTFLERWPTPQQCAAADLADVLRLWEGLGYPRRAKNLHAAAVAITELGALPCSLPGLLKLPGVGPYTARAVMAFAFEADVAVVDTNTARVLARWAGKRLDRQEVQAAADSMVAPGSGWVWNQAMLDLGAIVCTLRNPHCGDCPVVKQCAFRGSGEDPAIGTAGVSVPQSRFQGSDRQLRGELLRLIARAPVARTTAARQLDRSHEVDRVSKLVDMLINEGLVSEAQGFLVLGGGV
jgi:A/G-specific adenine glycosylase